MVKPFVTALGVVILHVLAFLALLQARVGCVRPVATISLIDLPLRARPAEIPRLKEPALLKAHLVFEAPSLPEWPVFAPPSEPDPPTRAEPAPLALPEAIAPLRPPMLADQLEVFCPGRSPPVYPPQSKHLREQGEVRLRVDLDEQGTVSDAGILKSSGFARLDEAARAAVFGWRCNPAMRGGKPTRAVAIQTLEFVLARR